MYRNLFLLPVCAGAILSLSACMTDEQVDAKLSKGCEAAVKILIEPKEIIDLKSVRYANELEADGMHRHVTLTVTERDGWAENENEYACLFAEQWGAFKSSHIAQLVRVEIDGRHVGKKDGVITGEMQDFIKLTETVDKAMDQ